MSEEFTQKVIRVLCGAHTSHGALRKFSSESETANTKAFVTCEPSGRQRLDHYGTSSYRDDDDEEYEDEGWDEDAWYEEYANPLATSVREILEKAGIPRAQVSIEIGEKGHVELYLSPPKT